MRVSETETPAVEPHGLSRQRRSRDSDIQPDSNDCSSHFDSEERN
jgi:hypothetical protein